MPPNGGWADITGSLHTLELSAPNNVVADASGDGAAEHSIIGWVPNTPIQITLEATIVGIDGGANFAIFIGGDHGPGVLVSFVMDGGEIDIDDYGTTFDAVPFTFAPGPCVAVIVFDGTTTQIFVNSVLVYTSQTVNWSATFPTLGFYIGGTQGHVNVTSITAALPSVFTDSFIYTPGELTGQGTWIAHPIFPNSTNVLASSNVSVDPADTLAGNASPLPPGLPTSAGPFTASLSFTTKVTAIGNTGLNITLTDADLDDLAVSITIDNLAGEASGDAVYGASTDTFAAIAITPGVLHTLAFIYDGVGAWSVTLDNVVLCGQSVAPLTPSAITAISFFIADSSGTEDIKAQHIGFS